MQNSTNINTKNYNNNNNKEDLRNIISKKTFKKLPVLLIIILKMNIYK